MQQMAAQLENARLAVRGVSDSTDPAVQRLASSVAELAETLGLLARVSPQLTFPPS
jgi:hypothetical protein